MDRSAPRSPATSATLCTVRIALVLNSRSGSVGNPDDLTNAIRARCDHLTVHAIDAAEAAAATKPDRLIVAGGDGSLGTAFAAADRHDLTLGVIPAGTANDFARALDLPLDLDDAVALVTDPDAGLRKTWAGLANDRPFVNVASAGLAVDAAAAAEKFKRALGPAAYAAGAVRAGLEARPVRASVQIDEDDVDDVTGRVWQVLVGATGRFGGGSGLGDAVPGSPKLTVAWVPAGSRATLPIRAIGLRSRTIERQAGVLSWQSETPIVHASRHGRPAVWNLDGERWEPATNRVAFRPIGPVPVVIPERP